MTTRATVELKHSHRARPAARRVKATAPDTPIEVQVYLKPGALKRDARGRPPAERLTREALAAERAALLDTPYRTIERFAATHGLVVVRREPARRMIRLAGPAEALRAAFGATLHDYRAGDERFRARSGSLHVEPAVARVVEAVLGFSTRPLATPALGPVPPADPGGGRLPNAYAGLYEIPATATRGAGQRIALVQLGGRYYPDDTAAAFAAMGAPIPTVVPIAVGGATQAPDPQLDRELALDVQVAGGIAPRATLLLYSAPPGPGGAVDAVSAAIHDAVHRPTIVSLSFGAEELAWGADARKTFGAAFADAAHLGVTVVAASGDMLATAGYGDGAAHVAYPASDPYVLGCGGTTLAGGREAVWNDGQGNGTGGGVSCLWPVPAWQKGVPRHATSGKPGRGVPDVAGIADGAVGWRIRCRGEWRVESGTSAVAPLWAGLIALANAEAGIDAGFVNPRLYAAPAAFNDVTAGDNIVDGVGYRAGPGWDACTGLGSPRGAAIMALLRTRS